ncbi:MAG TPA: hypothetical protein EYP25_10970 [Anaerolineae bacterium]|nr:hypothetical protein [Anaerolineae bacterium]
MHQRALRPLLGFFLASIALLMPGCSGSLPFVKTPTPSPTATFTPEPTSTPTPTPTPIPAILTVPLQSYTAPNALFRIEIPENWTPFEEGGGIRFQNPDDPYISLTTFYFPLPEDADADAFLQREAERALLLQLLRRVRDNLRRAVEETTSPCRDAAGSAPHAPSGGEEGGTG